jgi:hypothetical protein
VPQALLEQPRESLRQPETQVGLGGEGAGILGKWCSLLLEVRAGTLEAL